MSKDIRIEKVKNGYVLRVFGGEGHDGYGDTYVYSEFFQVIEFVALQFNEHSFVDKFHKTFCVTE